MPEPRYFSMPSTEDGAAVRMKSRLELLAVGAVVHSFARGSDPFPRRHHGGVADHGDQVAMPPRPGSQHAEAVLGIVEGDALDQPGQYLPDRDLRLPAGAGLSRRTGGGSGQQTLFRPGPTARLGKVPKPARDNTGECRPAGFVPHHPARIPTPAGHPPHPRSTRSLHGCQPQSRSHGSPTGPQAWAGAASSRSGTRGPR